MNVDCLGVDETICGRLVNCALDINSDSILASDIRLAESRPLAAPESNIYLWASKVFGIVSFLVH